MRKVATALAVLICVLLASTAHAQQPGGTIGFRNQSKFKLIVQGTSVSDGMQQRGQPLLLYPGKVAFDANVPVGRRVYSVYDANQPANVLLRDIPVAMQGFDIFLTIRATPTGQVTLLQE